MSLTVVSVNHHSSSYLRFQDHLARSLADGPMFRRLVGNVTPTPSEKAALERLPHAKILDLDPENRVGSDSHGWALNQLLPHVRTEHALVLDPDCVPLASGWDVTCAAELRGDCSAIGVSYPPKGRRRYRGFPNAICFFAPTETLKAIGADFEAESPWLRKQKERLHQRLRIELDHRDVGWRLPRQYSGNRLTAKCFEFLKATDSASAVLAPDCGGDEHHWKGIPIFTHQGRGSQPFGGGQWSFLWVERVCRYLGASAETVKQVRGGEEPGRLGWLPRPPQGAGREVPA